MPSRPLSPDRHAITQLHTLVDVEAIAATKGGTDRSAAVARLATLVQPTRVDLVDEVMTRIGTRKADRLEGLAALRPDLRAPPRSKRRTLVR